MPLNSLHSSFQTPRPPVGSRNVSTGFRMMVLRRDILRHPVGLRPHIVSLPRWPPSIPETRVPRRRRHFSAEREPSSSRLRLPGRGLVRAGDDGVGGGEPASKASHLRSIPSASWRTWSSAQSSPTQIIGTSYSDTAVVAAWRRRQRSNSQVLTRPGGARHLISRPVSSRPTGARSAARPDTVK
jgi:hypothetical protein